MFHNVVKNPSRSSVTLTDASLVSSLIRFHRHMGGTCRAEQRHDAPTKNKHNDSIKILNTTGSILMLLSCCRLLFLDQTN